MSVTANFAGPVQTDGTNRFRALQSMARATKTATQAIATSTATAVSWDSAPENTDGMWAAGNPTRLTAPITGKYLIGFNLEWAASNLGTYRQIYTRVNGVTPASPACTQDNSFTANQTDVLTSSMIRALSAGDYVELIVNQDTGGNLNVNATYSNFFMLYVGE